MYLCVNRSCCCSSSPVDHFFHPPSRSSSSHWSGFTALTSYGEKYGSEWWIGADIDGGGWEREAMYYFSKAIGAINQKLCDERERASDNMIACVSMFSNMEVRKRYPLPINICRPPNG